MSNPHFSNYVSPNIVIVPTVSFCGPPAKKQKPNAAPVAKTVPIVPVPIKKPCATVHPMKNTSEVTYPKENVTANLQIHENSFSMTTCCTDNTNRNSLEDSEQRVKKTLSWASNYLQSIGQLQPKVIKPTNSAHQKLCSKVDENRQQNTTKTLFTPVLKHPVTTQTHPESFQRNTLTASEKNEMLINNSKVADTDDNKNSPQDTINPIKINLLNYKQNTDMHSDKTQRQNTNKSKPTNSGKSKAEKLPSPSKSGKNDSKMFVNDAQSTTKLRGSYNLAKDKYDKNTSTSKNIRVKNYVDVKKYKNKVSLESKHVAKSNDLRKSECKTNEELQAWTSARMHNNSKSRLNLHSKDKLQTLASNSIKSNPAKIACYDSNNKLQSKNSNEKKEKNKVKSSKSKSKKDKNADDHESKSKITDVRKPNSKPSNNRNDNDNKNQFKSSKRSDNHMSSESSHLTPIKSVVQMTNKYNLDGSYKKAENNHRVEDLRTKLNVPEKGHSIEDLRSKLKRKHQISQPSKRDQLIITVQNNNTEQKESILPMAEEKPKLEKKAKKYKKIKLVINVVCEDFSETSESESDIHENNNDEFPVAHEDLSFLDDFNVDDIVESLNVQQDKENNNKGPSKVHESKNNITEKSEDKKCINSPDRLDSETTRLINLEQNKDENETIQNKIKRKDDTSFQSSKLTAINAIQALDQISTRLEQNTAEKIQHGGNSSSILLRDDSNVPVVSPNKQKNSHNSNENNVIELDFMPNSHTDIGLSKSNVASNTNELIKKSLNFQNDTKLMEEADTQCKSNVITNPKPEKEVEVRDSIIIDLTHIEPNIAHEKEKISSNKDIDNVQSIIHAARKHIKDSSVPAVQDLIDLTLSPDKITEIYRGTVTNVKKSPTKNDTEAHSRKTTLGMVDNPKKHMAMSSQLQHSETKDSLKTVIEIDLTESSKKRKGMSGSNNNSDVSLNTSTEQQHAVKEILENIYTNSHSTQITSETSNKTVATTASNNYIAASGLKIVDSKVLLDSQKDDFNKSASDNKAIKEFTEEASKLDKCISTSEEKSVKIDILATGNNTHNIPEFKTLDINEASSNNTEIKDITREKSMEIATEQHNSVNNTLTLNDINEQSTEIVPETLNSTINKDGQQVIDKSSKDTDSDKTLIDSSTSVSINISVAGDTKEEATTKINPESESNNSDSSKENQSLVESNKDKSDSSNAKLNNKKTPEILALENRMLQYLRTKYSIESLINHGKFSKIFMCKDDNGRNYALKVLNKGRRLIGCRIEDMLKDLQKDIPRSNYHCVFLVNGFAMMDHWCFLMDYYPKNLQQVLKENKKCFHIDNVQVLARQLVSAVLILRNNNIMHLDIKPSHVLMNTSNDRLKLAGFDESQFLEGLSVLPNIGTVNYRPPEVIIGFPYFGKIDVWSSALVIYEMCTARQLFPGCYNNDILYKQMCTLGNLPREMVVQSVFTNYHFRGAYFARRYGHAGQQCVLIDNFKRSMRLPTSLFDAYNRDWAKLRNKKQRADDSAKLRVLRDLLEEMLLLDPTRRTPIEFVYANSFIYETFDSCL